MNKYKFKWIGFKVVAGVSGNVSKKLKRLGFIKTNFSRNCPLPFDYVRPCGLNCCETLGKMRDMSMKGICNCFTDAEWAQGKLVSRLSKINYMD